MIIKYNTQLNPRAIDELFIEMESRNEISKNDCQVFINSIDENQDNQIDQNELIEFILHGLNLNNFQRFIY